MSVELLLNRGLIMINVKMQILSLRTPRLLVFVNTMVFRSNPNVGKVILLRDHHASPRHPFLDFSKIL